MMSAQGGQQEWYIEEISVKDDVESAVSVSSVSSAGKSEKANEAADSTNVYLGTAILGKGKSKVNVASGDAPVWWMRFLCNVFCFEDISEDFNTTTECTLTHYLRDGATRGACWTG